MNADARMSFSAYWFCAKARAFLWRDLLFETSYKLQSLFRVLAVLLQIVTFYFLSTLVGGERTREHLESYGEDYFTFVLVGIAFSGVVDAGLLGFTQAIRQQLTIGVFEAMAAAPIRSAALLFHSMLWPLAFELAKSVLYLSLGAVFFGARVRVVDAALLAATVALSVLVFGSLGLIAASLIVYFKRGDPLAWLLSTVTVLIGGVYFPVSVLPGWLESLAKLIPVPYALDLFRASLIPSAARPNPAADLLALGAFALVLVPAGWLVSTRLVEKARAEGSLGQY